MKNLFHIETCTDGDSTKPPTPDGKWSRLGVAIEGRRAADQCVINTRMRFPHVEPSRIRIVEWAEYQQFRETLTADERDHIMEEYIAHFGWENVWNSIEQRRLAARDQGPK